MISSAVWAVYLAKKVNALIKKQKREACLAIDLPESFAKELIERLESGATFLCWEVEGLVTVFLSIDRYGCSNAVHEQISSDISYELNMAMKEVPGDALTKKAICFRLTVLSQTLKGLSPDGSQGSV